MITYISLPVEISQAKNFMEIYRDRGYGKNVLGVTDDEFLRFIFIGKLCEIAFTSILRERSVLFAADDQLIPAAGAHRIGADLVLTKSNQGVDVKAAHAAYHTRILVREDQFQAHVHDLYVGAKYVTDQRIDFFGYITGSELSEVAPRDFGKGLARYFQLDLLKPIEKFIELARAGKVV